MRCGKSREYVSQELDGRLPPAATGKLRDHLDSCSDCRAYQDELMLGQRLLAATEPELPENFEWKLQLRLNQALQQAAGEVQYPWHEEKSDRGAWLRNFGAATAVGLAAVLALAMFFGPVSPTVQSSRSGDLAGVTDRRPLFQPAPGGLYRPASQRLVSTGGIAGGRTVSGMLDRGWSGSSNQDALTIRRLRAENAQLRNVLLQYQRANELMRTRLDTSGTDALDLQHGQ